MIISVLNIIGFITAGDRGRIRLWGHNDLIKVLIWFQTNVWTVLAKILWLKSWAGWRKSSWLRKICGCEHFYQWCFRWKNSIPLICGGTQVHIKGLLVIDRHRELLKGINLVVKLRLHRILETRLFYGELLRNERFREHHWWRDTTESVFILKLSVID